MTLSPEARERYSRMIKLHDMSETDMVSITKSRVAVLGAGGLGSPALRLLTSIGFGLIRIVDRDKVELSNLQRQSLYSTADVGKSKATAAATNLRRLNREVEFEVVREEISRENALSLVDGVDVIVDGLDSFETRRAVNEASVKLRIPYVFAGAVEYFANMSTFVPGKTPCFACVMGEANDNPQNTAAVRGVEPCLLAMTAAVQVREASLLAMGRPPNLAGRVMTIDVSSYGFDMFEISRARDCPVCGCLGSEE